MSQNDTTPDVWVLCKPLKAIALLCSSKAHHFSRWKQSSLQKQRIDILHPKIKEIWEMSPRKQVSPACLAKEAMLFQQYKGPFNPVAWTEGKFPPFSKFPSRQQQSKGLLFNILLLLQWGFWINWASPMPEQNCSPPCQCSSRTRAELSSHCLRTALLQSKHRRYSFSLLLPEHHSIQAAAEEALFPVTCWCHCSRTSTEGCTFFIYLQHHSIRRTAQEDMPPV